MKDLICKPCPAPEEFVPADKLPSHLCETPEVIERPSLLPNISIEEVVTDNYEDSLRLVLRTHNCEHEPAKPEYTPPMVFGKPHLGVYMQPYEFSYVTNNGEPPYRYQLKDGILPMGMRFDPLTGTISGTPVEDGTFFFVIVVRDERNRSNSLLSSVEVIA